MNKRKVNKQQGFTLIEVMITVGIVAILAAVAIPSYVKQVQKGKRSDAKVELLRIAQLQESYFVQNLSYAQDLTTGSGGLGLGASVESEQGEYDITLAKGPGSCDGTSTAPCTSYTITATPNGGQANDAECANFTLTNTGVKDVSVSGHGARCWK